MLKIFQAEENAEPVEIGMADRVRFRWEGTGQPLAGGGIYELREFHAPEGLRIYGLKTPLSPIWLPSAGSRVDRQEYDNAMLIIAHLTHLLGGGVTIHPFEMVTASKLELTSYQQRDPHLFIMKTKEK